LQELPNVESLTAKNDLDIGNVTVAAGRLRASRLNRGSVLFAGANGLLSEHTGSLTYNPATGTLAADTLKVSKLVQGSDIDAQGSTIR
jgi:hypothetical protein